MGRIVVATAEEDLRHQLVGLLAGAGLPVETAATWEGLVQRLAAPACSLALVDARLPGLDPDLLQVVTTSLSHGPHLRLVRGTAPPLTAAPVRQQDLLRLARRATRSGLSSDLRKELRLLGAGPDTFADLVGLAAAGQPIVIQGERGSGKQRIAEALHLLSGDPGPFVARALGEPWTSPATEGGTLYLEGFEAREPEEVRTLLVRVRASGWRLIGGCRRPPGAVARSTTWDRMVLAPLRERSDELRSLTLHYLDRYRRQLGLPRRRFHRSVWALVLAYRWPGNARELETFVVQALTGTRATVIRAEALPDRVRHLVDPAPDTQLRDLTIAFEEVVETRLRALVQQVEPDSGVEVRRLAVEATERALYRLALARTGGNQLAAARLLGVARNTLRSRATRLGVLRSV